MHIHAMHAFIFLEMMSSGTHCQHTHTANWGEIGAKVIVEKAKKAAHKDPYEDPQAIWDQVLQDVVTVEVAGQMPAARTAKKMIQNVQRGEKGHGKEPQNLKDIEHIPDRYICLKNQRWLLKDTGKEDPERQLIFATDEGLHTLFTSTYVLGDGTFKTVPRMFLQLYTLHGNGIHGVFTPFV